MKILYIGQYEKGATSRMRGEKLSALIPNCSMQIIDTTIPYKTCGRMARSMGVRFKVGPLIKKTNEYIQANLPNSHCDLIWVDKAVFLTPITTKRLRGLTDRLLHFTPDMAFFDNRSAHFEKCIDMYNFLVTTKTAEISEYKKRVTKAKLILATQGFDRNIHKSIVPFSKKESAVVFVGLCEPNREQLVQLLIDQGIKINLAGRGWGAFLKRNSGNKFLDFSGEDVIAGDYALLLSGSLLGLGLLSKKFPELHTTRTFEIPACGTALITESNQEINSFFNQDEAIFFDSPEELVSKIKYYLLRRDKLQRLTQKGEVRVHQDGRDYESILRKIIQEIGLDGYAK